MGKTGLSFLFLLVGLVAGILVGDLIFRGNAPEPGAPVARQQTVPHVDHFYYRLNDSMMARHTVGVSDSGLYHTIDTIAIQPAVLAVQ